MESLHKVSSNVIFTIAVSIICLVLLHKSGALEDAGMAAMFLNWLPVIVGAGTLICYFIARAIKKEAGWIVTGLGAVFNIFLLISAFNGAS